MGLKTWLGNKTTPGDSNKLHAQVCLPSARAFDPHTLVERLDPELQFFADSFYESFQKILPKAYILAPDNQAPESVNCLGPYRPSQPFTGISLEYRMIRGPQSYKFGTGRVELRHNHFFAKVVTWKTPKDFLHQFGVYDLIKRYYPESRIMGSKSSTGKGFAIKNKRHIITLEVFGAHRTNGFLACDLTLNGNNKPLAKERMERFLEFYGCLYNLLENQDLTYDVQPRDHGEVDVEYVQDALTDPEENHIPEESGRFPVMRSSL